MEDSWLAVMPAKMKTNVYTLQQTHNELLRTFNHSLLNTCDVPAKHAEQHNRKTMCKSVTTMV